jgi:RNA polymerase sigma factor (sigma-70 family)
MAQQRLEAVVRRLHEMAEGPVHAEAGDGQLLRQFLATRDEAAFAALLRRHGPMVLGVARRVLGHDQDAEDVFQAVFLVLARKASAIRKRASVASWLHGVALRLALRERARREGRRVRERRGAAMGGAKADVGAAWEELQAALHEALLALPERQRAALVLCYLEGSTHEEAARQLGCPLATLRSWLARGRKRLHGLLTRRGLALSAGAFGVLMAAATGEAALPARLLRPTLRAALGFAASPKAAAVVSPAVARLVDVGLRSLAGPRKVVTALLLVAALVAGGAGLSAYSRSGARPSDPAPAVQPANANREVARADRHGDPLPTGAMARLGTLRFRHGNATTLAFTADGEALLSCGADRTLRFWDPASGRLLRDQRLPAGERIFAVLSPDGRLLAFKEWQGDIRLWDVVKGRLLHRLPAGDGGWDPLAFSPDGKTLVAVLSSRDSDTQTVKAWDVATGKGRVLGQHQGQVWSLSFTADGTLVTLGSENRAQFLHFWDLAGGRERSRVVTPERVPHAVISPDGRTVAAITYFNGPSEGRVLFWDAATGQLMPGWTAPDVKRVMAAQFTPDGKAVLVCTDAGVLVWDPRAGKRLRSLPGGGNYDFRFSPDGRTVAALNAGRPDHARGTMLHVWDLATGAAHPANASELGHQGEVDGVAFAPDGRTVASCCQAEDRVCLWEASTGRLVRSLPTKDLIAHALAFSADGRSLFVGTSPAIVRRDVVTGREIGRYPLFETGKGDRHHLLCMHLTDDGRTILAVSQNLDARGGGWGLHAWDPATGKRLRGDAFSAGPFWVAYSRFSADGRLLAVPDGSVRDTATGKTLLHLTIEGKRPGTPVAFSPDGVLVAEGIWQEIKRPPLQGWERVGVQVWELATLLPVARLKTGELADVAFTPDGRRLVTAGPASVGLWDLASGREVARRPAPSRFCGSFGPSFASSFALAADGHTVATGQPDTAVLLWDLRAPARPGAPLTAAELEACWAELAGADGGRALTALARLADVPGQAVPLLRARLRPARAPSAEELRRLLTELDSRDFARRDTATKRLRNLGELAEETLREALHGKPSLEVQRRVESLLAGPRLVRAPEDRRHLRAVRVLEGAGTPEARRVLEGLAGGASRARLTREARAALGRLDRRPASRP